MLVVCSINKIYVRIIPPPLTFVLFTVARTRVSATSQQTTVVGSRPTIIAKIPTLKLQMSSIFLQVATSVCPKGSVTAYATLGTITLKFVALMAGTVARVSTFYFF
jgi:hypothetical protein